MMKLYDHPVSGHSHRVRALLKMLELDFEIELIDLMKGEHKAPAFLAINPLGQIPTFIDNDVVLRDSTAILTYLALKYDVSRQWMPSDPALAAEVQSWLSVSVHEIYDGPCVARVTKLFNFDNDLDKAVQKSHDVFASLFEPHLTKQDWLVGDGATIADIANYSYIARAEEGSVSLENYPNIVTWLKRVESLPGFEPMAHAADLMGKN